MRNGRHGFAIRSPDRLTRELDAQVVTEHAIESGINGRVPDEQPATIVEDVEGGDPVDTAYEGSARRPGRARNAAESRKRFPCCRSKSATRAKRREIVTAISGRVASL
jgi:hypothetical protein